MKWLFTVLFVLFASAVTYAQSTVAPDCPPDRVCLTIQQARQALMDADMVKAQEKELAAKDQAIADFQKELNSMRIELAKAVGEKTGSEQMVVRLTAIVDVLLKGQKKKCMPFSVCLF